MKHLIIFLAAALTLAGCSKTDPNKVLVKEHLAESLGTEASSVKITELSEPAAWLVSDSLVILKVEFEKRKAEKMEHLNKAIEHSQEAIDQAVKSKEGNFMALNKLADQTIAESKSTIDQVEAMINTLNGDCSGTDLEGLYNHISEMEPRSEEVLYNVINGKYKSGGTESEFVLMADKDMSSIVRSF